MVKPFGDRGAPDHSEELTAPHHD